MVGVTGQDELLGVGIFSDGAGVWYPWEAKAA